jgi:hypothetical protein
MDFHVTMALFARFRPHIHQILSRGLGLASLPCIGARPLFPYRGICLRLTHGQRRAFGFIGFRQLKRFRSLPCGLLLPRPRKRFVFSAAECHLWHNQNQELLGFRNGSLVL